MLSQDYLTLRQVRLKPSEDWHYQVDELAFVLPRGGAGRYIMGLVTQRVAPGELLILNGKARGKLSPAGKGELSFWWFSTKLEHLFPLFAGKEICLLQDVTEGFKGCKLYPGTSALARECHRLLGEVPTDFNLEHRGQLLRVVAAILTEEFKLARKQRVGYVKAEAHMLQVFESLSSAELLNLSVGELAEKFGCSRRHLNRLFRQHFEISVAALRMEMRLMKAASLLRDPDAKVINVAEQCGFNHLGLFNICFKRRFGVSPGQWRKSEGQGTNQKGGNGEDEAMRDAQGGGELASSDEEGREELSAEKKRPGKVLFAVNGLDASDAVHMVDARCVMTPEEIFNRACEILRSAVKDQGARVTA